MAIFRYQGNEIEVVENWRVGEQVEAENALGIDLETAKSAGRMALVLYISIRRADKQTPAGALADQVLRMELTDIVSDKPGDDAGPPDAEPADEKEAGSETYEQPTSGHPLSASSV